VYDGGSVFCLFLSLAVQYLSGFVSKVCMRLECINLNEHIDFRWERSGKVERINRSLRVTHQRDFVPVVLLAEIVEEEDVLEIGVDEIIREMRA
jgi:hypothetical protein